MRIKLSELREVIRSVVEESYGWPVASEMHLYGTPTKIDVQNPRDPKNSALKLPKGPNSRSDMNEGFKRPTQKELAEWAKGNYDEVDEVSGDADPCEQCGEMTPSGSLTKTKNEAGKESYVCQMCLSGH
jgi:hypothetical protein